MAGQVAVPGSEDDPIGSDGQSAQASQLHGIFQQVSLSERLRLDIKELRSFCMVAKLGSFSKASEALGLGQPAVTKHVQRLEAEIGRALLERGMRPLRVTAAGTNLLRMAEPLVEGLEGLSHLGPFAITARVAVGVPHGFVGYALPQAVRQLRQQLPATRTRVLSGTKEEVFEMVETGSVDFAVAPDPGPSRSLEFTPLYPSERIVITPQDHPFAKEAPKSLKELAQYPLIVPRFHTETRALLEREFRRLKVPYEIAVELDSVEMLERYVELGVGLGIGLRGAADAVSGIRLPIVSLARFLPSQTIGVVRSRAVALSDPALALIRQLEEIGRSAERRPGRRGSIRNSG
ncbi:LysR family transcriptional regulator [Ramlibacter sp.]|uniref:LysR family transcriptional regulator n=1 Tax=Ramlibacter sp. TaxID=1917967 RepID=UPI00261E5044|nr:LysR family transcriptional regulator [Ramlibacter sp.]